MGLEELLSKKLKENNISFGFTPWDEMTDAVFEINKDVYIQVAGYCDKPYIVNQWVDNHSAIREAGEYGINQLPKLINKIKELS